MRLFGLIGYPLSHSFSEKFFSRKFRVEGLTDCNYRLFPIPSITQLPMLLDSNPGIKGLNVTVPYKKQVLSYLTSAKNIPDALHACNCIKVDSNNQLIGYNTDWIGFEKSLVPLLQPHHKKALVLGSGGAAAAIIYVLDRLKIDSITVSRQNQPGSMIYEAVDESLMLENHLIINTTPLGMYPLTEQCPAIPYGCITPHHLLYDLVYNPAETVFLKKGKERGAAVKNGEEMLILQAEESWKIWNS